MKKKTGPVRMASRVRRLARDAAKVERREEAAGADILHALASAQIQAMLPTTKAQPGPAERPMLPALLIVNSKSGPNHDSLVHVGELVDLLAGHGIAAEVRVKLHKSQARRMAKAAARARYPLVLVAGGDGSVTAVARGLVGSRTVLGIIPLGTYNNVATSLGIPKDTAEACALIAAAPVRAIDVGEVRARGMKRPRQFLELGAVGIAAPLAIAGQGFEKGRWDDVLRHLPDAVGMAPTVLGVRIDGRGPEHRSESLLAIVANTPRSGAGLLLAPQARLDDGLLEVRVYEHMSQPVLATHFLAVKTGTAGADSRIRRWRGRKLVIRSSTPLPVVVDSKVVGSTPAHFRVRTGALKVIAGTGDGLLNPIAPALSMAIEQQPRDRSQPPVLAVVDAGPSALAPLPAISASLGLARKNRSLGVGLASGVAVVLMPTLARWLGRRRK